MLAPFIAVFTLFSSFIPSAVAQADTHNVTSLAGTWSSGSGAVQTGPVRDEL